MQSNKYRIWFMSWKGENFLEVKAKDEKKARELAEKKLNRVFALKKCFRLMESYIIDDKIDSIEKYLIKKNEIIKRYIDVDLIPKNQIEDIELTYEQYLEFQPEHRTTRWSCPYCIVNRNCFTCPMWKAGNDCFDDGSTWQAVNETIDYLSDRQAIAMGRELYKLGKRFVREYGERMGWLKSYKIKFKVEEKYKAFMIVRARKWTEAESEMFSIWKKKLRGLNCKIINAKEMK